MVTFEDTHHPLTERDLNDVERLIGIKLPRDLRNHYILHNGGRPNPRFFPCGDELYGIHYFFAMKTGNPNIGFEETYMDFAFANPFFPKGFIPFAIDEVGDYFLYSIRPGHFGEIAFNQSDYFGDESRFVVKLSDNLAKFIESLVDEDD
jgi:cell wall assembly regulator SMI1